MCSVNCILFGARNLLDEEIRGRRILEVGSCDINGSLRRFVESRKPAEYIGIDIIPGLGVDLICNAENLLDKFGKESFDVVISTELLEHVRKWQRVISNLKLVCKPMGTILITTRSFSFPFHSYPFDYWRYELEDMKEIFADCQIQILEKDPEKGVFLKAIKPQNFSERDLSAYMLYSMPLARKASHVMDCDLKSWHYRTLLAKTKARGMLEGIASKVLHFL